MQTVRVAAAIMCGTAGFLLHSGVTANSRMAGNFRAVRSKLGKRRRRRWSGKYGRSLTRKLR